MNCQIEIKVEPLSVDEAWLLFKEKLGHERVLASDVEEIAKDVVNECAGLPLAIITVAGSMRGVDDIREWRNVLNELRGQSKGLINMENDVHGSLKFSYDRLKDARLQQCLLYCALFPEDQKIPRDNLIIHWIADGIIDEKTTMQEEFDCGHALLNRLEYACLLERARGYNHEICVKMHDVIRDMALNIARENHHFMVKAGVKLTQLPEEREWTENLERVSLSYNNNLGGRISRISPCCSRLRTLMLQMNFRIKKIPNSFFAHMQNLRVLDMSWSIELEHLPDSISDSGKLQALLLFQCEKLTYVPSLEKLTKLMVLDPRHIGIKELPHGIEKLVNLKRLEFYPSAYANDEQEFQSGVIPNPSHLQLVRLGGCSITDDAHLNELVDCTQLEALEISFSNSQVFNSYVKTQHWQRLSSYCLRAWRGGHLVRGPKICCKQVHIRKCNLVNGEDPLILPLNMQELNIEECNDFESLSFLKNARELERCWIQLCAGIKHLWSWSIPLGEEESEGCTNTNTLLLQSLRTLWLSSLPNLRVMFKGVGTPPKCGAFSNLKLLSVGFCSNLKYVFTRGLVQHHLQNLEVVHVYCCRDMENIIVAEEEEERQDDVDNNLFITFPKLRSLELWVLPELKSIWKGTMACPLQQIRVANCELLRRLPLSVHMNGDGPTSLPLKKINGGQEWWDSLEWDHPDIKSTFQPLFHASINNFTGWARADEIWKQDLEHYEMC